MKIAIDGMGGDQAPRVIVQGVQKAAAMFPDMHFEIFGDQEKINHYLNEEKNISVVHTTEVITGSDEPVRSIRRKKDASLVVAARSVKEGKNDALFSAGNTGALLAAGTLIVGRIRNIDRPALMGLMPDLKNNGQPTVFLDLGANADSKPENINQYGVIGSYFSKTLTGTAEPSVALLNNGTEAGKGSMTTQKAYTLLNENPHIHFAGNIEARDLLAQKNNVIVADGFTGNAVLKTTEGTALTMMSLLKSAIKDGGLKGKIGAYLLKDSLKAMKSKLDYSELGGAILVGVKAPVMKTHGSTDAHAVLQTLIQTRKILEDRVVENLVEFFDD